MACCKGLPNCSGLDIKMSFFKNCLISLGTLGTLVSELTSFEDTDILEKVKWIADTSHKIESWPQLIPKTPVRHVHTRCHLVAKNL